MTYSVLKPPFELNFKKMKRERARAYLEWFVAHIPKRVLVLTQYVKQGEKYASWEGNLSPDSLGLLGEWFWVSAWRLSLPVPPPSVSMRSSGSSSSPFLRLSFVVARGWGFA